MTTRIRTRDGQVGELTTDHAASSYGQPVLLLDGGAATYGPGDAPDPLLVPDGPDDEELLERWYQMVFGATPRLYGVAEIADAVGVSNILMAQWRKRGKLPDADVELARGPVWYASTIEPWIKERRGK